MASFTQYCLKDVSTLLLIWMHCLFLLLCHILLSKRAIFLSVLLSIDIGVVPDLGLLWKTLLWAFCFLRNRLFLVNFILRGRSIFQVDLLLRMKFPSHSLCISSTLTNTEKWFFKLLCTHFHFIHQPIRFSFIPILTNSWYILPFSFQQFDR